MQNFRLILYWWFPFDHSGEVQRYIPSVKKESCMMGRNMNDQKFRLVQTESICRLQNKCE